MVPGMDMPLITTRPEFCRACYTCVRECPAKAIRIAEGQAQVLPDRCIACGNCVQVCSQRAKQVASSVGFVTGLLQSGARLAACLAPSFPAEFPFADPARVAGMIKALGFAYVHDVGFGADLVSLRYRHLVENAQGHRYVATNCPAIVGYVKRYHPELVSALAPLVSPMIAMARVARTL
ncbi:MAG TPA: [Fe-Fe] hydrogenase large subunit C-terminal domain-containing protein, partial [Candidatus Hydrogenedentes bacterium]|nr:[Fe-Fe] hydrogenase large subunit C-terminal domain-containing protein [Candidatus Hydrogenedentota bacterium]